MSLSGILTIKRFFVDKFREELRESARPSKRRSDVKRAGPANCIGTRTASQDALRASGRAGATEEKAEANSTAAGLKTGATEAKLGVTAEKAEAKATTAGLPGKERRDAKNAEDPRYKGNNMARPAKNQS